MCTALVHWNQVLGLVITWLWTQTFCPSFCLVYTIAWTKNHSKVARQTRGGRSGFEAIACSNHHTTYTLIGIGTAVDASSQQIHHAYIACMLASVTTVTLPIHPLFLGIKIMDRYDIAAPGGNRFTYCCPAIVTWLNHGMYHSSICLLQTSGDFIRLPLHYYIVHIKSWRGYQ